MMAVSPSAERGREVRRRLVAAAAELIPEVGWSAVSTRMLAERAGVATGLVHYHFASVQALLADAAVGVMRGAVEELRAILDGASTAVQMLDSMLESLDHYSGQDPTSLLFAETFLAATRDEQLRASLGHIVDEFRQLLAERLAQAGVQSPDETAAVLAAAVDGLILHRALSPGLTAASDCAGSAQGPADIAGAEGDQTFRAGAARGCGGPDGSRARGLSRHSQTRTPCGTSTRACSSDTGSL